jgi:PIN domain nuclease of toxin-antitoxin system
VARVLRRVVVDTGPILSVLLGDAAAAEVSATVAGRDCGVSVVNVAEVLDVDVRVHRAPVDEASEALDRILADVARPLPAPRALAEHAALLRARHDHRRDRDLSLADCFAIATAMPDADVATSDAAIAKVARAEGVDVVALPNARGRRP